MLTRRKFLAMLAALPALGHGIGSVSLEQYWWLPKRQREWIAGAGHAPHEFGHTEWLTPTKYVHHRCVTTDVNYWRLSCIAHGGHDPLTPPWRRSRKIDQRIVAEIMATARV